MSERSSDKKSTPAGDDRTSDSVMLQMHRDLAAKVGIVPAILIQVAIIAFALLILILILIQV